MVCCCFADLLRPQAGVTSSFDNGAQLQSHQNQSIKRRPEPTAGRGAKPVVLHRAAAFWSSPPVKMQRQIYHKGKRTRKEGISSSKMVPVQFLKYYEMKQGKQQATQW